jgi:uncharacterized damage-inducible protein DinB
MKRLPDLVQQTLHAWQRNAQISDTLIAAIPDPALAIAPYGPRARTLGQQLAHVHNVRCGWVGQNHAALAKSLDRFPRGSSPTRGGLRAAFRSSAKALEEVLRQALLGERRIKLFGGEPVLFLAYLVAHESHHRGQIATHLRQQGHPLPEDVVVNGLWSAWGYSAMSIKI